MPSQPTKKPENADRSLVSDAEALLPQAVELRRSIHAEPELGLDLPLTQRKVLDALEGLGLEITLGTATTSVVAVLHGSHPGPTTLLRGDMDALPMTETSGVSFASRFEGRMHSCGHDAHVAMLAGAARILAARKKDLAGKVVFMFQPGEEGQAGARVMIEEGLLANHGTIDRAFAIHVIPGIASGCVTTRRGTLMASTDEITISVTGAGGHGSMPHDAVDPIPAAAEIVTSLQTMVTRRVPVGDPGVVTIGKLRAGTTFNVIPDDAVMQGTIRAWSSTTRETLVEGARGVVEHVAAAHGCIGRFEISQSSYPVTVNDDDSADALIHLAGQLFGSDKALDMPTPVMGAEDWSFVLQQVPGCMAFLGVHPPGVESPEPNHSPRFALDEKPMATGIALHAAVALAN